MDKELDKFDKHLKNEQNRVTFEKVKDKMAKAKKLADESESRANDEEDLFEVARLIVDNNLLLSKLDEVFGKQPPAPKKDNSDGSYRTDFDESQGDDPLSESLIDKLYSQFKKGGSEKKKRPPSQTRVVT